MELPSFDEHTEYMERTHNIVEVSSSAFKRVAAEYDNPYAVGAFAVISNSEPYDRFIFIDKDLYKMSRPSNPEETFEDIKPFSIQHELTELYAMLVDRISGRRELNAIDTEHDELARYEHLKAAHAAGLLDKMLEFHMVIQLICQWQLEELSGRPHLNGPDSETMRVIGKTAAIAERIRHQDAAKDSTGTVISSE